ncbi:hypothetical protein BG74_05145, partial [Sodalis-like endosymbiont of Proechinophthirus fluctus]|uniref:hypothetical protein n=1 Tax=Sodalis-like endosymbiont of Proechinophthirus fluctus TaxID=1462730 RepID=UPI0007A93349
GGSALHFPFMTVVVAVARSRQCSTECDFHFGETGSPLEQRHQGVFHFFDHILTDLIALSEQL